MGLAFFIFLFQIYLLILNYFSDMQFLLFISCDVPLINKVRQYVSFSLQDSCYIIVCIPYIIYKYYIFVYIYIHNIIYYICIILTEK